MDKILKESLKDGTEAEDFDKILKNSINNTKMAEESLIVMAVSLSLNEQ
jgi:hypothetical protein